MGDIFAVVRALVCAEAEEQRGCLMEGEEVNSNKYCNLTTVCVFNGDDGKQQEKLQVCGNNWVRRIVGVKIIDKRRMEELREEVGVRESHEEAGEEPAKVGWTRD